MTIAINSGHATWDWQISKWFARVQGMDMTFDTLEDMSTALSLSQDNIADLLAYKQHCEVINGGAH
jgi:hypothetical protein